MTDKHRQHPEWFPSGLQDYEWSKFEGRLYRALKKVEEYGHPVIRMSEKLFNKLLKGRYAYVSGSAWGVYIFRGYPVALRVDDREWKVVEVISDNDEAEVSFLAEVE